MTPKDLSEFLEANPDAMSLLYDLDFMPEQVEARRQAAIAEERERVHKEWRDALRKHLVIGTSKGPEEAAKAIARVKNVDIPALERGACEKIAKGYMNAYLDDMEGTTVSEFKELEEGYNAAHRIYTAIRARGGSDD